MSKPHMPTQPIEIPAEDGAIDELLTTLDSRMTAWINAVGAVHDAFTNEAAAVAEVTSTVHAEPPAVEAAMPAEEPTAEPCCEVIDDLAAEQDSARDEPGVAEDVPAEPVEEVRVDTTPLELHAEADTLCQEEPVRSSTRELSAEDRELLESLDPKLRMEIRIRRRLDSSRSVRELRDEIIAQQAQEPESSQRRWWRRSGK